MCDARHLARTPHDRVRALGAPRGVGRERVRGIRVGPEPVGQGDSVFDCLTGALPQVGEHRVCGVAEQRDAAGGPVRAWLPVVERRSDDRFGDCCVDERGDAGVPGAEAAQERVLLLYGVAAGRLGRPGARPPVDLRAGEPRETVQCAATPGFAGEELGCERRVRRDDAAPGGEAGIAWRSIADGGGADP
jgi:hypothetical protein